MIVELFKPTVKDNGFTINTKADGEKINLNVLYSEKFDLSLTSRISGILYLSLIPNANFFIHYPVSEEDIRILTLINRHVNTYDASLKKSNIYKPEFNYILEEEKDGELIRIPKKRSAALFLSGGRDSLLTLGLLGDLKFKISKIFVQPSAPWWFGSCGTYRKLGGYKIREDTSRLYPKLRQLGNDIRLDINSLLLWSVLSLPIVIKDNCNYLLYGNERVTSTLFRYRGETHYDYSWNQSQEATNAMSQYLSTKIQGLTVCSFLRPLNTITIQRNLCERFPDLFKIQISCNSAHPKDNSFVNCGSCEKCHRTFLILEAIGVDPNIVGLDPKKILSKRYSLLQLMRSYGMCPTAPEELFYVLSKKNRYFPELRFIEEGLTTDELTFDNHMADMSILPKDLFLDLYGMFTNDSAYVIIDDKKIYLPLKKIYDTLKTNKVKPVFDFEKEKLQKPKKSFLGV